MGWMIGIGFIANLGWKYCSIHTKIPGFITKDWDQQVLPELQVGLSPPKFGHLVSKKFQYQQDGLGTPRLAALGPAGFPIPNHKI